MDANNISTIRKHLGLTQKSFGEGIGVTQGNINNYERQRQSVPPRVARRVIEFARARGVHVSFDDIYADARHNVFPAESGPKEGMT